MNILLLCGDARQLIIKERLEKAGHQVLHICYYSDLETDFSKFEAVIFPLPTTRDGVFINNTLTDDKIKISDITDRLINQKILCGNYSFEHFEFTDYGQDEATAILNAVPTAEGAIAIAINNTPFTLWKSRCLVVGYGRIGKALSERLSALTADVTVSARRETDLAFIESKGYKSVKTSEIADTAKNYDIIFNTVAAPVITNDVLNNCRNDCLLVELASHPYGIDFKAAEEYGLRVIMAQGLPGKTSHKTAADIISSTILKILNNDSTQKR